jgi:hypothetical protein
MSFEEFEIECKLLINAKTEFLNNGGTEEEFKKEQIYKYFARNYRLESNMDFDAVIKRYNKLRKKEDAIFHRLPGCYGMKG